MTDCSLGTPFPRCLSCGLPEGELSVGCAEHPTKVEPQFKNAADTELWERDLKAARAEVTFWQGQVAELTRQRDEAHTAGASLMRDNQSLCALAVSLRNDIVRLVTAALGTWDDEASSDWQIAEAEQRIKELRSTAVVLPDSNELRRGWQTIIEAHLHMEGGLDMWELVTQLYDQLDHTIKPAAQVLEGGGTDG